MITQGIETGFRALGRRARQFISAEQGIMAPHILFFFFLMLLVGGVAVDVMRFETRRVAVQNTMDRATLAAASLEQSLEPIAVVHDYFDKSGLAEELDSVTVDEGMNYRIVQARATVKSGNYFMSMMDIPYLEAQNRSQAEQRVTNVEISLVLDVSGSMYNTPSRIANLKTAAKDFIDTVLDSDTENKISIAIVPYNGQVNIGPQLYSKFTKSDAHSYTNSYCLDLPTSTYADTTLSRTTAYPQTPFGDSWSGTSQSTSYVAIQSPSYDSTRGLYSNTWCQPVAGNFVRMHNNNATTLKGQIDGLVAVGATSIDLGMKWGAFLIDPSSRSITEEMATAGQVPNYFSTRPAEYGDRETLKVIVLMTDGENFTQERFGEDYRSETSDIWRHTSSAYMSAFHASKVNSSSSTNICNSRPFWVPHLGAWHSRPWNGTTPSSSACYVPNSTYSGVTRLTWNQVWTYARTDWVAWQMYARPLCSTSSCRTTTYNLWEGRFAGYTEVTEMNSRLDDVCEATKDQGVIIYGIAFEAPTGGVDAIRDCSSTPSSTYFFDVDGLDIGTAFELIASNLSQLRLTQ